MIGAPVYALNFYSPIVADQLRSGRKTATIRLGDKAGKYRKGMLRKFLGLTPVRSGGRPCAWFHAVSVGEVLLLRQVIARFRERHPSWECVLSTTTNTGFDVASASYPDLTVFYWPFDFTWAVKSALRTIQPTLVILSEGELWPNFVWAAKSQGAKLALINGRMSPRSAGRFLTFRWLLAGVFAKLDWIGAQNDEYRRHYEALGAVSAGYDVVGACERAAAASREARA